MVDSVLHGEGLERVAAIVARAAEAPVAIVVPRLGAAALAGDGRRPAGRAAPLRHGSCARPAGQRSRECIASEAPITSGDELVGAVLLLAGDGKPAPEASEYLHLAAVACLTEVAVAEAREEVEENLRGSFIDDLRSRPDLDPADVVRRAARLGCDLSRGVVALCAELSSDRPRHVVATIAGDYPGALAQHLEGGGVPRVHALLPATGGDGAPEQTLARARTLAERLGRHGTVGLSSFYADPADIGRAIQEAELVLDVLRRSDGGQRRGPAGHRDRDLPVAVPRARLASRGGALVLRGHDRARRAVRRSVPHRSHRNPRGLLRAELQYERDGGGDLCASAYGRLSP